MLQSCQFYRDFLVVFFWCFWWWEAKHGSFCFLVQWKEDDFQVKRVCIQVFSMVSLVNVNEVYSLVGFYMLIAHDSSILSSPYYSVD